MAIRLITGVPGSGKTYYAVNHLLENYCKFDDKKQEYVLKNDHTIITNIDSLTLPHINLDDALSKSGKNIHDFFQVPYQEKISLKYKKIIYLLDEAQRFFPYRNKIGSETWFYFEYHRHLGHDVYIITQDKKLMAQNITLLAENELRAAKRTFSLLGEFRYLLKCDNEIIDRITIRSKKNVFDVYKSFEAQASEKIKNPFKKYIISFSVASVLVFAWFFHTAFAGGSFRPIRTADSAGVYGHSSKLPPSKNINQNSEEKKINHDLEKINSIPVNLNYYYRDSILYILDPITNQFSTQLNFSRPLKVSRSTGSRFISVTAQYLPGEIPTPAPAPSGGVDSAPPEYKPTYTHTNPNF